MNLWRSTQLLFSEWWTKSKVRFLGHEGQERRQLYDVGTGKENSSDAPEAEICSHLWNRRFFCWKAETEEKHRKCTCMRGVCANSIDCLYVTSLQPLNYSCRARRWTIHHRAPQCTAGTELAELPPKFLPRSLSINWNQHTCNCCSQCCKLCFWYGN